MNLRFLIIKTLILSLISLVLLSTLQAGSCDIQQSQLNFGVYSALESEAEKTNSSIELYCEGTGSYQISVTSGNGQFRRRKMISDNDHLFYNLFLNAGLNQVWGNGTGNTHSMNGYYRSNYGDYTRNEHFYYGAIYPQQDARPGRYKDDIFVSISF